MKRFTSILMIMAILAMQFGCASQQGTPMMQYAQQQPSYTYNLSQPAIIVVGGAETMVMSSQDFANAMQARPNMVVGIVEKAKAYADVALTNDMAAAGYSLQGQQVIKRKNVQLVEMRFQRNPDPQPSQQQLQMQQMQMQQQQQQNQGMSTGEKVAIGAGIVGIVGAIVLPLLMTNNR